MEQVFGWGNQHVARLMFWVHMKTEAASWSWCTYALRSFVCPALPPGQPVSEALFQKDFFMRILMYKYFPFSNALHKMTFPFLLNRNPLWTLSNPVLKHSFFSKQETCHVFPLSSRAAGFPPSFRPHLIICLA